MQTFIIIFTILITIIILAVYILRYLDGYYTIIKSEIIESGKVTRDYRTIGQYFITKTTYQNNRIVIKKSEHI